VTVFCALSVCSELFLAFCFVCFFFWIGIASFSVVLFCFCVLFLVGSFFFFCNGFLGFFYGSVVWQLAVVLQVLFFWLGCFGRLYWFFGVVVWWVLCGGALFILFFVGVWVGFNCGWVLGSFCLGLVFFLGLRLGLVLQTFFRFVFFFVLVFFGFFFYDGG